jgi:hypothetical protein
MSVKNMDDFLPSHREGLGVGPEAQVTDSHMRTIFTYWSRDTFT